ncbi:MAG: ergothioneine biosynthesis glutamate--cysteine ligase EgtA [Streptosporangiaceae bacterium]
MVIKLPVDAEVAGQILAEDQAEQMIGAICFKTGPPGTVGTELEWMVSDPTNPALSIPFERVSGIVSLLQRPGALPASGLLTLEPGGQVELSTAPAASVSECIAAARRDLAVLDAALAADGLALSGTGLDPLRRPRRGLNLPRYDAMEEYFDRRGAWGRLMMCSTASVQVCIDAGLDDGGPSGVGFRWRLLHAIGPVLVGAFANSPLRHGRPTGWKCTRQLIWHRLDPGRTHPPPGAEPGAATEPASSRAPDPRAGWAGYALDADLLCVRRPDGSWSAPAGLTFRDWLRGAPGRPEGGRPTADDLAYHLSTLFPPVRPRGHLELRMIDAQPGDGWIVPLAVVAALADDPAAAQAALAATGPVWRMAESPWLAAARDGLADPVLARAARDCFAAADAALARPGADPAIRSEVARFADRYVLRGRCPADDVLDNLREEP